MKNEKLLDNQYKLLGIIGVSFQLYIEILWMLMIFPGYLFNSNSFVLTIQSSWLVTAEKFNNHFISFFTVNHAENLQEIVEA